MPFVRQDSGINSGFIHAFHRTSEGESISKSRHAPVVKQNTRLLDVHALHKSQNSLLSPSHNDSAAALAAISAMSRKSMAQYRGICILMKAIINTSWWQMIMLTTANQQKQKVLCLAEVSKKVGPRFRTNGRRMPFKVSCQGGRSHQKATHQYSQLI